MLKFIYDSMNQVIHFKKKNKVPTFCIIPRTRMIQVTYTIKRKFRGITAFMDTEARILLLFYGKIAILVPRHYCKIKFTREILNEPI